MLFGTSTITWCRSGTGSVGLGMLFTRGTLVMARFRFSPLFVLENRKTRLMTLQADHSGVHASKLPKARGALFATAINQSGKMGQKKQFGAIFEEDFIRKLSPYTAQLKAQILVRKQECKKGQTDVFQIFLTNIWLPNLKPWDSMGKMFLGRQRPWKKKLPARSLRPCGTCHTYLSCKDSLSRTHTQRQFDRHNVPNQSEYVPTY